MLKVKKFKSITKSNYGQINGFILTCDYGNNVFTDVELKFNNTRHLTRTLSGITSEILKNMKKTKKGGKKNEII